MRKIKYLFLCMALCFNTLAFADSQFYEHEDIPCLVQIDNIFINLTEIRVVHGHWNDPDKCRIWMGYEYGSGPADVTFEKSICEKIVSNFKICMKTLSHPPVVIKKEE